MSLTILQLVPEALPTHRADVAVLFGKYLPRAGVACDMVGMPSAAAAEQQGYASLRRPAWHASRLLREARFFWLCLRALLGARRGNCDLIQARDMVSIGLLAMLVARLKGLPFCYWVSFLMSEGRIERARANLARQRSLRAYLVLWKGLAEQAVLYRLVLPGARHVFVQSDAMLAYMVARGVPAARLSAVPMGVDMELFGAGISAGARPAGWEARPMLGYLGSMDKERQLQTVVDALQLARRQIPDACLLLVGAAANAADTEQLMAYVRQQGLEDAVRITGWLPSSQAWQLLLSADAAVSYVPRNMLYDVSSPTKLLEYLALGLPAVGNDIPDQAHVLSSSDAGWLTASDAASMAQALVTIFKDTGAARARAARGPAYLRTARSYAVLSRQVAQQYRAIVDAGK
ncbi:glycosyltransferase group 1 [Janthinobacterium sp. HH01]|uniref:glycosyltransferase n=1 Tax=Janthinobacterium sp. HH01 TaxID=1198452 RepID=UPI0002AE820C|nr:glycosyltransferase [Janthinobacterium sp. HH01]ELX13302.1 glycosyltransferase group 1 [Janthinobacterium sp. HH01]